MAAHKNPLCISDVILFYVMLTAFVLEFLIPTTLLVSTTVSRAAGVMSIVCAWILIFAAKYQFKKTNQKTGPGNETGTLMTSGLFKYTRNPIYLGVVLIAPALGFLFDSIWAIIALIPLILLMQRLLILPEEKYLSDKFGIVFSDYCQKTRRWI